MKKISIIYWSNGGNVEVIANAIAESAQKNEAEVTMKHVVDATVEDVTEADAVAFGSPSMDNNRIEQQEMEPFINQFKLIQNHQKKLVLFGSYGWDDGKFMVDWIERMKDYGFNVVGSLAVKESPSDAELLEAAKLGEELTR
ncbi:flavodoxin [Clostridium septicum]|uniref:Flavodoxin n=1 Tax=Clostridium septicum TaxID=1504 RepID=A0A9N7JJQ5_CLOSE|nr:flavodoxin [Clostridium septicum]AYE33469.1 flavodoxin [Clostridium septicum]MDU1314788.1 flavodoxin [Clostridium septicum]QAS61640.1 flavodoxin [Clostridium septicum]UEC21922.1 flavodoxin [Clostridium septicum]USS00047.1 flavodoxin [Clostridium septicum]